MEKLRHVEISKAGFDLRNNKLGIFEESSKLENLRILRGVVIQICDPDSMDVLLGKFPNLQELDIKFLGYGDNAKFCPNLKSLIQLQILRLSFGGSIILCGLQLPSNLKKLVIMDVSSPLLETLVIKRCHWLEEIPHSFAYIPTLKQITFIWWVEQESLKASAVKIKEEVADIEGYDRIDISIGVIAVVTDGGVDCNVEFSCYVDSMISTFECVHDELIEPGSVLKVVLLVF
ncbi:hypothetical protein FXO37_06949 [Capsicum annuum]|nr:hypothetical protein FXO37_06949 [Capsicum annuum]